MSIKETVSKARGRVIGKLTDEQWETRIDGSQQKLDKLRADIVAILVRRVETNHRKDVYEALGLEAPAVAKDFRFALPTTSTRTYQASATSEVEAAKKLLAHVGDDGARVAEWNKHVSKAGNDTNIVRDVSSLKALIAADEAKTTETVATSPTDEIEVPVVERYAALEAEYEALRVAAYEQAVRLHQAWPGTYCASGVNDVLRSLGLPLLPEEKYFVYDVPVSGSVRHEVRAFTQEEALAKVQEQATRNVTQGENVAGYLVKVTEAGDATFVR